MAHQYKDPINGSESSVGPQIVTAYYQRKALEELRKEQFFTQLAHAQSIPPNFGKVIKRFHYMPILDDRNVNDEGIDRDRRRHHHIPRYVLHPCRQPVNPG